VNGARVYYWRDLPAETPIPFEAQVLFEDEHLVVADKPLVIDWRPVVAALVGDVLAGEPAERTASRFHDAVARMIDAVSERVAPAATLGLSGGVFQNALLVARTLIRRRRRDRDLLLHHAVPPNDGGLALGQAVLARRRLTDGHQAGSPQE
jgi:hydrogenase maturation factor HypF (carbamoyltransferase family)